MTKKISVFTIFLFLFYSVITSNTHASPKKRLPKITVYGNRHKNRSFSILSPEEVNNYQYKHLTDILNHSPSFNYTERSIFYRATNTEHTRIYIDGIEYNDLTAYNQSIDSSFVTTNNSSYISINDPHNYSQEDSIGANIQINSERGSGKSSQFALLEYGSRDTSSFEYKIQGEREKIDFNITLKNEYTQGIKTKPPALRTVNRHYEPNNIHKLNFHSRFGLQCTPDVRIQTFHRGSHNDAEYIHFAPQTPSGLSSLRNHMNKIDLIHALKNNNLNSKISLYNLQFKRNQHVLEDSSQDTFVNSHQQGIQIEHSQHLTPLYSYNIKSDSQNHKFSSSELIKKSFKQKIILGHSFKFNSSSTLHLKKSYIKSKRNNDFNYSIIYEHFVRKIKTHINIVYKTASLEPSLMQLYIPQWGGNPNLKTEKSTLSQIDLIKPIQKNIVLTTSFFLQHLKDLIHSKKVGIDQWELHNIGKVRSHGIELKINYTIGNWKFLSGYSYLNFKNLEDSQILIRRPRHTYNISILHEHDDFIKGMQCTFKRGGYDSSSVDWNSPKHHNIPPIFRIFTSNKISSTPDLWGFFRIENVFNRYYESPKEYAQKGIGIFVGIKTNIP